MSMNIGGCGNIGISVGAGNGAPAALSAPVNVVLPAISGTLQVGDTLTSTTGTWTGNPAPTYIYRWKRGVTTIGTDSPTYVLVEADAGLNITCEVDATNSEGGPITAVSNILVPNALAAPAFTVNPTITGSGAANTVHTLTSLGTVTGNPTPTLDSGQWQLDNVDVPGETASTYSPDANGSLTNEVTASNSQGNTAQDSNAITITGAAGLTVNNQTPDFGLSTRVGEGAWIPDSSGGTITSAVIDSQTNAGEFTINSDGSLEPLAALTAGSSTVTCTYNGTVSATHTVGKVNSGGAGDWTITTGEIAGLFTALGAGTLDNGTVWCREDSFPTGTTDTEAARWDPGITFDFPTGLILNSHDITRQGEFKRCRFRGSGIHDFRNIKFHAEYDYTADNHIFGVLEFANDAKTIKLDNVTVSSTDTTEIYQLWKGGPQTGVPLPGYIFTGTGLYTGDDAGGGTQTVISFDKMAVNDQPNLSQLTVGLSQRANIILEALFFTSTANAWQITAADDVLKTITVESTSLGSQPLPDLRSANNEEFALGDIHTLNGVVVLGGTGRLVWDIQNCTFEDLYTGLSYGQPSDMFLCQNLFQRCVFDFIKGSVTGDETRDEVINNLFYDPMGRARDPQNPHVDLRQKIGTTTHIQNNTVPHYFCGNISASFNGRSNFAQGSFSESLGAGQTLLMEVSHNIIVTTAANAITNEQAGDGTRIFNNSLIFDNIINTNEVGQIPPQIITTGGDAAVVETENVFIMNNFVGAIGEENATVTNNVELGGTVPANTTAIIDNHLAGPDLTPDLWADLAELKSNLLPSETPLNPTGRPGIGAQHTGYWDYTATTRAAAETGPMYETAFDPANIVDLTDVAISTVSTSAAVTMPTLGSAGVMVWAIGGNSTQHKTTTGADVTIVDWSDATIPVHLDTGEKYLIRTTSDASNSTATNVTVYAGENSATWSVTTVAAGFTAVAVDNGGNVYGFDNTFSGPAASKVGSFSIWFQIPTTWPTATEVFYEFRTSGGNVMFEIKTASSGRLQIIGRNAANTVILNRTTNTSEFAVDTWYNLLGSYDLATTTCNIFKNDVEITSWATTTTTDDLIGAIGRAGEFAQTTGSNIVDGYFAPGWFDLETHIDLTVTANRRDFIDASGKPVDTSAFGTPQYAPTNSVASWWTNLGDGGDLAETGGTLVAAPSSPSD